MAQLNVVALVTIIVTGSLLLAFTLRVVYLYCKWGRVRRHGARGSQGRQGPMLQAALLALQARRRGARPSSRTLRTQQAPPPSYEEAVNLEPPPIFVIAIKDQAVPLPPPYSEVLEAQSTSRSDHQRF